MATNFSNAGMDELARSPAVTGPVMKATEKIAQTIRNDAPVDSGDFRDGIQTHLKFQERGVGIVQATDEKSLIIEAKTGVMARAVKKNARKR